MSREIKFRALEGDGFIYSDGDEEHFWAIVGLNKLKVQQFTGLLDKNGKEIYEGDILHWYLYTDNGYRDQLIDKNLVCEWRGGRYVLRDGTFPHDLHTFQKSEITKVGNIYENPDLLTHPHA